MKKDIKVSSINPVKNNTNYNYKNHKNQVNNFNGSFEHEKEREKSSEEPKYELDYTAKRKLIEALSMVKEGVTIKDISKVLFIPKKEIYNFIYSELKQLNKDLYYELKQIFNTSEYEKQKRK